MKKYFYTLVLVLVLFGKTYAQIGWMRITSPSNNPHPSHFWASDSGTAGLSITTNGGISWQTMTLPMAYQNIDQNNVTTGLRWDAVFAYSSTTYLALGTSYLENPTISPVYPYGYAFYNPKLQLTTNGGLQWDDMTRFDSSSDCGISRFIQDSHPNLTFCMIDGAACGGAIDATEATIQFTLDGGKQWLQHHIYIGAEVGLPCDFVDSNSFLAQEFFTYPYLSFTQYTLSGLSDSVEKKSFLARTTAGDSMVYSDVTVLRHLHGSILLAGIESLLRSEDLGRTWKSMIDSCRVTDIARANDTVAYVALLKERAWQIYRTEDAGLTWKLQLKITDDKNTISFISLAAPIDSVAYAFCDNNIAYKTANAGGMKVTYDTALSLGVSEINGRDKIGIQCFPNPASDKVQMLVNNNGSFHYMLLDMLGITRKQGISLGCDLNIDVSDLPLGNYYLRINSNGVTYGKSLIIIR
jgi:hypothetical protein